MTFQILLAVKIGISRTNLVDRFSGRPLSVKTSNLWSLVEKQERDKDDQRCDDHSEGDGDPELCGR